MSVTPALLVIVYGLMSVTVHMSSPLPRETLRGRLPFVLNQVTFLSVNRTQNLAQSKSSLAHADY